MLTFGWSEIALTLVVVVIVVGPKDIPNLLKQLGSFSKLLKKIARDFKKLLNNLVEEGDLKDIKKSFSEIQNLKEDINIKKDLDNEINSIKDTVKFTDKEISEINNKILKN